MLLEPHMYYIKKINFYSRKNAYSETLIILKRIKKLAKIETFFGTYLVKL